MLATSTGKRNVTVWHRPSVRLSHGHTNHDSPGAACNVASVHFVLTVRRTDVLVLRAGWESKRSPISLECKYLVVVLYTCRCIL